MYLRPYNLRIWGHRVSYHFFCHMYAFGCKDIIRLLSDFGCHFLELTTSWRDYIT